MAGRASGSASQSLYGTKTGQGVKVAYYGVIFYNAILASDIESDIYVSGEAGHKHRMLARYRSSGKDP